MQTHICKIYICLAGGGGGGGVELAEFRHLQLDTLRHTAGVLPWSPVSEPLKVTKYPTGTTTGTTMDPADGLHLLLSGLGWREACCHCGGVFISNISTPPTITLFIVLLGMI